MNAARVEAIASVRYGRSRVNDVGLTTVCWTSPGAHDTAAAVSSASAHTTLTIIVPTRSLLTTPMNGTAATIPAHATAR
jgi:hypothetical protein